MLTHDNIDIAYLEPVETYIKTVVTYHKTAVPYHKTAVPYHKTVVTVKNPGATYHRKETFLASGTTFFRHVATYLQGKTKFTRRTRWEL